MKKIFIILITILIGCDRTKTNKELYFEATKLENEEYYKEANLIHNEILKKNAYFRPSLINRGANKSQLKNYKEAILDYKRIIKFDNKNTLAFCNIANNYLKLNLNDSAIFYFSKAINVAKKQKLIFIEYNGDFDKDFQYYVEINELRLEKALVLHKMKEFKKAESVFKEIIDSKNRILDGTSYYQIGKSYEYLKDTVNACLNYRKAMKNGIISGVEINELVRINKICEE
jgi:tetratricopeptide (TPR) repeat protein